jgi:hypothetical protein
VAKITNAACPTGDSSAHALGDSAASEDSMPWSKPNPYEPRPDLAQYLKSIGPKMNTSEMDMVIYWQWVHAALPGLERTKEEAWEALHMSRLHAQDAIDKKIVPLEIYDLALARANQPPVQLAA